MVVCMRVGGALVVQRPVAEAAGEQQ